MLSRYKNTTGVAVALLLLSGCSESDSLRVQDSNNAADTELSAIGSHTPHTGPADGIWPPQPQNMTNVEPYPASARAGVLNGVLSAARGSITNNPQVRSSLGSDYREIDATLGDEKSDVIASIIFYNYSINETVIASLENDGTVSSVTSPASVYQPMEHPEEQLDAIALARTALTNSSFDVTGLESTAMLAYPQQSSLPSANEQFYDHRVLYVTFGPGSGALPVYTALVDISDAVVLEHGLVK